MIDKTFKEFQRKYFNDFIQEDLRIVLMSDIQDFIELLKSKIEARIKELNKRADKLYTIYRKDEIIELNGRIAELKEFLDVKDNERKRNIRKV